MGTDLVIFERSLFIAIASVSFGILDIFVELQRDNKKVAGAMVFAGCQLPAVTSCFDREFAMDSCWKLRLQVLVHTAHQCKEFSMFCLLHLLEPRDKIIYPLPPPIVGHKAFL